MRPRRRCSLARGLAPAGHRTPFPTPPPRLTSQLSVNASGSTAGSSWRQVKEALRAITPNCTAHDADCIDVLFLNHKSNSTAQSSKGSAATGYRGTTDTRIVERFFASVRPSGGTPTGPTGIRLHHILKPYLQLCAEKARSDALESIKPIIIIVITDGVPSRLRRRRERPHLRRQEAQRPRRPPYQVGVQFFQVDNEPGAREALEELDDGLCYLVEGGVRDMVDAVTWSSRSGGSGAAGSQLTANGILKTVLGAFAKRLDRRRASGESRRRQPLAP